MRPGAHLINVSRGNLVGTEAAIAALETGQLGAFGLDVYEQEGNRILCTEAMLLTIGFAVELHGICNGQNPEWRKNFL